MKKNHFKNILMVLSGMFLTGFVLYQDTNQDSNLLNSVCTKLKEYNDLNPQQKVYLHTDKTRYTAADKVWFKAYLVDASSLLPDHKSSNLYVELINPEGYMVQAKRIKLSEGTGNGEFSFRDTVPEGRYMIRAYTNVMRNQDEDFYFKKDIYIKNPLYANYATRENVRRVKKAIRQTGSRQEDYDVSFHPEGGNLLLGVENRVAFKAINELGQSVEVEGELKDKKGNVIAELKSRHAGMGSFRFTPLKNSTYFFHARSSGRENKNFKLPEARELGISLRIDKTDEGMFAVSLVTNLNSSNYPPNPVYALVAHSSGIVKFRGEMDIRDSQKQILIPDSLFPAGIAHFTLFNYRESPISERLVFIHERPVQEISITSSKSGLNKREENTVKIQLRDREGNPVNGSYSMAVVNKSEQFPAENIISYFFLGSDIKGNIENPGYYFSGSGKTIENDLDLLMMTQGWKRFDWPEITVEKKIPPPYSYQKGIEIGGKITREFFGLPLKDIKVSLTILNEYNDVVVTRSDLKGNFLFDGLDYTDTMKVKLEAVKPSGRKNLVIVVEDDITRKIRKFDYLTEQNLQKPGEEGRWINQIPEEEVDNDPFKEQNNDYPRIHPEPNKSNVIIMDESLRNYQSVAQIIQGRVPGVNVHGNSITIRGPSTFYGNTDPLFLVDGMPMDAQSALSMSPYDIDRIEILKGADAAIYGARGANGVIAIYTKRGKFMKKGEIEFEMLGYVSPAEFYSPRYDVRKTEMLEDDRSTLMWVPNVSFNEKGVAEIRLFSSDIPGNYTICVEGLTSGGIPVAGNSSFTVR